MTTRLAPTMVGAGVTAAHRDGAYGSVVGAFRHGCYVQVDGCTYAVAGPAVPAGPLHLVLAEAPQAVTEGLAVWRVGDRLRSTDWEVDLRAASVFAPPSPGRHGVVAAAPALDAMLERLVVPADLASRWDAVRGAVDQADLPRVRRLLEGRGAGLTPTGDDVLAGVLLVQAWCGGDQDVLLETAQAAATTNLSRSFLSWAARGQSLAPVHDLLEQAGDAHRFESIVATIAAIGSSSGTALLWGIGLAARAAVSRGRAAAAPTA